MVISLRRLAVVAASGAVLLLGGGAQAQCDPAVCANPYGSQTLPDGLAPRTFTTLKAAKSYCRSEPIVWRANAGGRVYAAKEKGFGKKKPGFYMCKSHAQAVARLNAGIGQKPR
jgi:hypothetical protein